MTFIIWAIAFFIAVRLAYKVVKYTPDGFYLRYGVNPQNLHISDNDDCADVVHIYERRVRQNIHRNRRGEVLSIPLEVEEFRRVSMVPGMDYLQAVSGWFKNTYEAREDGKCRLEKLMYVRPLTAHERETLWPEVLRETLAAEKELDKKLEQDRLTDKKREELWKTHLGNKKAHH